MTRMEKEEEGAYPEARNQIKVLACPRLITDRLDSTTISIYLLFLSVPAVWS